MIWSKADVGVSIPDSFDETVEDLYELFGTAVDNERLNAAMVLANEKYGNLIYKSFGKHLEEDDL